MQVTMAIYRKLLEETKVKVRGTFEALFDLSDPQALTAMWQAKKKSIKGCFIGDPTNPEDDAFLILAVKIE